MGLISKPRRGGIICFSVFGGPDAAKLNDELRGPIVTLSFRGFRHIENCLQCSKLRVCVGAGRTYEPYITFHYVPQPTMRLFFALIAVYFNFR